MTSLTARLSARLARSFRVVVATGPAITVTACANDGLTAPVSAPQHDAAPSQALVENLTYTVTGTLTKVTGLAWSKKVSAVTVSKVIGASGGSIAIDGGIKLIVPKGAVASNVTFSVTRLAGTVVAYDFEPHGTTFAVPLQIEQPTLGTNFSKWPTSAKVRGAYFPALNLLDQLAGTALVSEFRTAMVSADKTWIKFTVDHFSGYMVSMD